MQRKFWSVESTLQQSPHLVCVLLQQGHLHATFAHAALTIDAYVYPSSESKRPSFYFPIVAAAARAIVRSTAAARGVSSPDCQLTVAAQGVFTPHHCVQPSPITALASCIASS